MKEMQKIGVKMQCLEIALRVVAPDKMVETAECFYRWIMKEKATKKSSK